MGADLVDRRDRVAGLPRLLRWTGAAVVLGAFPVAVLVLSDEGVARFLSRLCWRSWIAFRWVALALAPLLFALVYRRTLPHAVRFMRGHPRIGLGALVLSLLSLIPLAFLALTLLLGSFTAWWAA